ncbi:Acetyl-coenzyme A transporter 1 [Halotydeus destructor]|nr:Acetyl-coenzyme A transporter 1 [Halotydeus destructor]
MSNIKKDLPSILLLFALYIIQGIPLGISSAIPLIFQSKHVSYGDQAVFFAAHWPFIIKLLWAPLVDSLYVAKFGRRKSWLVPVQFLIGLVLIILSTKVEALGLQGSGPVLVGPITAIFFVIQLLVATQDIAVNGWSLTLLSKENVPMSAICHQVGQAIGMFLGGNFLILVQDGGIVTIKSFCYVTGIIYHIFTIYIAIFKKEPQVAQDDNVHNLSVTNTYFLLYKILKLKNIQFLIVLVLTNQIAFAAPDALFDLKLIDYGLTKEQLATMSTFMYPVGILVPWLILKKMIGPRPLNVFLISYPIRLITGMVLTVLLWWTMMANGSFPAIYFVVVTAAFAIQKTLVDFMLLSLKSFFVKIADPLIGGTYVTLLFSLLNVSAAVPLQGALGLVDYLDIKNSAGNLLIDGFYVEITFCTLFGLVWISLGASRLRKLQDVPSWSWEICGTERTKEMDA